MENAPTHPGLLGNANNDALFNSTVLKDTKTLEEMGLDLDNDQGSFVSRSIAAQSFGDYLTDADTDAENSVLPPTRRWVWYCKLRNCPGYNSAWACKTNFLRHLYETPVHLADSSTKTRDGRRQLARNWREETAYDLSESKRIPPQAGETEGMEQLGARSEYLDIIAEKVSMGQGL
jgi:hypothetical protein